MLIEELVVQYEAYSDKELYSVYSKIGDYSDEAKAALDIVIKRKGGIEIIKSHLASQARIEAEISRIKNETTQLSKPGTDSGFIKKLIKSEILPQEKIDEIIDEKIYTLSLEKEDVAIKPRTVIGSIIGGAIAGTIGGVLWGLQMIYSGHIFYLFLIGLIILCYYTIKFSTKQSKKNSVVVVATIISVVYALVLGFILYQIVGYQGVNP